MTKVAVIDYGLANIRSVVNALSCFEVEVEVAETGGALKEADRIVLPGVGSFDAGMRGLRERGHDDALERRVRRDGVPFLGICLGLQFLTEGSAEGSEAGLGWINGVCEKFPDGDGNPKVPHMGWDSITGSGSGVLLNEIELPADLYFVHSYFVPNSGEAADIATATCNHGLDFVAALESGNICAAQFHPEKSQLAGMKMLQNFVAAAW